MASLHDTLLLIPDLGRRVYHIIITDKEASPYAWYSRFRGEVEPSIYGALVFSREVFNLTVIADSITALDTIEEQLFSLISKDPELTLEAIGEEGLLPDSADVIARSYQVAEHD